MSSEQPTNSPPTSASELPRVGYVALAGRPNAGKSTLFNAFLGQRLSIVTSNPQTTRGRILGILTRPQSQIIFLDTPGLLDADYKLHRTMENQIDQAARQAALNAIAHIKSAAGDLDKVKTIIRIEGYVHCAEGFRDHPQVLNGASDLIAEIFGDRGIHTRLALGINEMPLNAAVQLAMIVEVAD